MQTAFINLAYLVAAVLLIMTFKGLAHPRTAVRANRMGSLGMLIAIVATLVNRQIIDYKIIIAGFVVGSAIGIGLASLAS